MIRDARVLRAGFVPSEIEHRDAEVNHLSTVLQPITDGEPADTAVVTGASGVGKTCISKFVTERLREEVLDVEATYVNCWRNFTRYRTLYQILDDLGQTIDIHRQSTPHDELVDRLQQYEVHRPHVGCSCFDRTRSRNHFPDIEDDGVHGLHGRSQPAYAGWFSRNRGSLLDTSPAAFQVYFLQSGRGQISLACFETASDPH